MDIGQQLYEEELSRSLVVAEYGICEKETLMTVLQYPFLFPISIISFTGGRMPRVLPALEWKES